MTPLARLLHARIAADGPLGVDSYISAALGHPEHGYYVRGEPFGRAGDFVTAPEISQIFGELLGLWCAEVWRAMGQPARLRLVELGPGRGTLLTDALRAIASVAPDFIQAMQLHLVETSEVLRARQEANLRASTAPLPSAAWHARLADVPDGPMILLANEFFDALPMRQFVKAEDGWHERVIGIANESFAFSVGPRADPLPPAELGDIADALPGSVLEVCRAAEDLVAGIATRLATKRGAALIIDYGHPQMALGETLQAVRNHRPADPLTDPGEVDLSHHVDFGRLRLVAERAGGRVLGPIAQGLFLGRLGIAERAEALAAANPEGADAISGAVRRLVHPGRMGVLFKAMGLASPDVATLPGFSPRR